MKNRKISCLVVDDHPITAEAYIDLLTRTIADAKFNFYEANTAEKAYSFIETSYIKNKAIDIALIDINIPKFEKQNIFSGTELASYLRSKYPKCLIVLLTMHDEYIIINSALTMVNPDGFISKNDIDFQSFPKIIESILNGETYYSTTISKAINLHINKNTNLDQIDFQIVLLLAKNVKTKELPQYIDLSLSAIEKRKASIKRNLVSQKITDQELVQFCKKTKLI